MPELPDVTVYLDDIHETSEVRQPGDYGTLVIPVWVALGLRLVELVKPALA